MKHLCKIGLATAALLTSAAVTTPVSAADLRGSLKDHGYTSPVAYHRGSVGSCYGRADVGGSIAQTPDTTWPVFNEVFNNIPFDNAGADTVIDPDEIGFVLAGNQVTRADLDNTWLAEVGAGCGSGSKGFRGEITFGFRGKQDFIGEPAIYDGTILGQPEAGVVPEDIDDPLNTSIQSHTVMVNAFYDFGMIYGVVPYVGAGVGAAYHQVDEVFFTGNPNLTNTIESNENVSFAWSVMAGVGYQVSDRAILDVGYRYIDMGEAKSGRVDSAGFVNPPATFDNIAAHEIKVGLRYHFGGSRGHAMPLK